MIYKIKSMVVGFRLSNWEPESSILKTLYESVYPEIIKNYPKQINVIDSRITFKKSYDGRFLILTYLISYYYDGEELIKADRNVLIEVFKNKVKGLISNYLNAHEILFREIEN